MSNRDPISSKPFSPSNDPFAPTSDDPLATTPGRTDVPLTEPLDRANDAYVDPMGRNDASRQGQASDKAGQAKEKAGDMAGKAQEKAGQAQAKAGEVVGKAQEMAGEAGEKMHSRTDQGIDTAASGLGQAAGMLRQQGEQREGTVGTAATKTADTLESASSYLQEKDADQLMSDLESLVRRKPVESVLVAAGIGYVLSRIVS
ncbi:MAG: CsbD family protein [Chloroflexota bacterium]|nr:CsbD family protein [Chloroflexota bacterium]